MRLIGNKDSPLNRVSANLINCHSVSKANHKSKCPRTHLLLSLNAPVDYRLGHQVFILKRRVRFPSGVQYKLG